jgi:hypothetical protein
MSVSGIASGSYNYTSTLQANFKQRVQDFEDLDNDLQSGNLSGAQSAFSALEHDSQSAPQTGTGQPSVQNIAFFSDFKNVGNALQSDDLSGAQKAFSALEQYMQSLQQNQFSAPNASAANATKTSHASMVSGASYGNSAAGKASAAGSSQIARGGLIGKSTAGSDSNSSGGNTNDSTDLSEMNSTQGSTGSGDGSVLQQLQKELKNLNKDIANEMASTDDAATKQAELTELETGVTVLEMRISQEQAKQAKNQQGSSEKGQQSETSQSIQNTLNNSINLVA